MLAVVVFACLAARAGAFVYWSNNSLGLAVGTVGRSNLDGSAVDQSFSMAGNTPQGVAVDGAHLYAGLHNPDRIERSNLDGSGVDQSFITGLGAAVTGVAVDGSTSTGPTPSPATIGRANLDGTGVDQSFITGASAPTGWRSTASTSTGPTTAAARSGGRTSTAPASNQSFITGAEQPVRGRGRRPAHLLDQLGNEHDRAGEPRRHRRGPELHHRRRSARSGWRSTAEHIYWANFGRHANFGTIVTTTIGRANLDGSGLDENFITGADSPDGVAVDSLEPPSASIMTPVAGATYAVGQVVDSSFGCREGTSGPGIASCLDQGGRASGAAIDTSTIGTHTLTVTATSSDRATGSASVRYTVAAAPSASIQSPVTGASYAVGQVVHSSFGCSEGAFGPGIASCRDAKGADAPAGVIDTSRAGRFAYRVTVISKDGQTATASIGYTVQAPPSASVTTPADGATYTRGQTLIANYACAEGAFGPGLASCAGTVAGGARIDTSRVGNYSFTVVAASKDGQRTTTTVRYRVLLPSNHFNVAHIHALASGRLSFAVKTPGPGTIDVLETAWNDNLARAAIVLNPPRGGLSTLASTRSRAERARSRSPSGSTRARRLVAHHRYRVTLRLWVSYTPTAGNPRSIGFYGLHLAR